MGTRQHQTDRRARFAPAGRLGIVAAAPLSASVCAGALPSLCGTVRPPGQGSLFLPS
jgi:hypothetical protein